MFEADEDGDPVSEAFVPVPTIDDDINEPEQLFVLFLTLVGTVNPDGIDGTTRRMSIARILDNDGK